MNSSRPAVPVMDAPASLNQVRNVGASRAISPATGRTYRPKRQTEVPVGDDTIDDGLQKIGETQEE
jgi:hypothetical protein